MNTLRLYNVFIRLISIIKLRVPQIVTDVGGSSGAGFVIGALLGGIVGFVLRPSVPLLGQLPFKTVITAGSNLTGFDQILKPWAEQSFQYLVGGVILGGVAGLLIGRTRRPSLPHPNPTSYAPPVQTTYAFCPSCGSAVLVAGPFCPNCGNRRA